MPHLPAHNTIRVALKMELGDDVDVLNVFHYQLAAGGPYSATVLNNVAEGFFQNWGGDIMPHLSHELSLLSASAHDISVVNGGDGEWIPPGGPIAGGSTDSSTAASVAAVGSWREFISYRGGHPRTYLAGIPKGQIATPQTLLSAYATSLQTALSSWLGDVNANASWPGPEPGALVVVHYALNKVVQNPPQIFDILAVSVSDRIHSQRRRLQ